MRMSFGIVLALAGVLALGAHAQPAHDDHDGHDHSEGGHTHEPKNPADETTLEYFWRKSDEAFHAGDYERAVGLHKGIVALDPSDVESFSVAAWLIWSMGQKEDALAHIDRGLKANENNWEMWDAAGQHYDLQKRENADLAPKAKMAYARAVELLAKDADKPNGQMLRRRLAHAAEKADDLPLSVATWRDLVRDFPEDAVNKNNLARVEKTISENQRSAALPFVLSAVALTLMTGTGALVRRRSSSTLQ